MKLDPELERQLKELVEDEQLQLVAVEMVGRGPGAVLRLVIDGTDGVTLENCSMISRQASALLDVEDPIRHHYSLEVSSPGLERKLYSPEDYDRFQGHRVNVRMQPSYREHRTVVGELLATDDETLRIRADSGDVIELPVAQVFETRLEVDWTSLFKEAKRRR